MQSLSKARSVCANTYTDICHGQLNAVLFNRVMHLLDGFDYRTPRPRLCTKTKGASGGFPSSVHKSCSRFDLAHVARYILRRMKGAVTPANHIEWIGCLLQFSASQASIQGSVPLYLVDVTLPQATLNPYHFCHPRTPFLSVTDRSAWVSWSRPGRSFVPCLHSHASNLNQAWTLCGVVKCLNLRSRVSVVLIEFTIL